VLSSSTIQDLLFISQILFKQAPSYADGLTHIRKPLERTQK
jgi:hypothetical protein